MMMRRTIWKFPLEIADEQVIKMPADAQVLSVGVAQGRLSLWALVYPHRAPKSRSIRIFGTGQPFDDADLQFIGTAVIDPLVWHVFEERCEIREGLGARRGRS